MCLCLCLFCHLPTVKIFKCLCVCFKFQNNNFFLEHLDWKKFCLKRERETKKIFFCQWIIIINWIIRWWWWFQLDWKKKIFSDFFYSTFGHPIMIVFKTFFEYFLFSLSLIRIYFFRDHFHLQFIWLMIVNGHCRHHHRHRQWQWQWIDLLLKMNSQYPVYIGNIVHFMHVMDVLYRFVSVSIVIIIIIPMIVLHSVVNVMIHLVIILVKRNPDINIVWMVGKVKTVINVCV